MEYWPFNEPSIINLLRGNDCLESTIFLKRTMGNSIQSLKMQLSPTKSEAGLSLWSDDFRLKSSLTIRVSGGCKPSGGVSGYLFIKHPKCLRSPVM